MTKDKKKQRLQRFLINRMTASGATEIIGTNGGLPFVEAAADKHIDRLRKSDNAVYHVLEITKLTQA